MFRAYYWHIEWKKSMAKTLWERISQSKFRFDGHDVALRARSFSLIFRMIIAVVAITGP